MLTAGLATVFANDKTNVPENLKEAFKKEFANAEILKWSDFGEYHVATFILDGGRAEAYFNADNELVGSVREVAFTQLPLVVVRSLNKRFAGADVLSIREITNTEGTSYRIFLETQQKKLYAKVSYNGNASEVVTAMK
jgi:hypothetical protein